MIDIRVHIFSFVGFFSHLTLVAICLFMRGFLFCVTTFIFLFWVQLMDFTSFLRGATSEPEAEGARANRMHLRRREWGTVII